MTGLFGSPFFTIVKRNGDRGFGEIIFASEGIFETTGYRAEEVIQKSMFFMAGHLTELKTLNLIRDQVKSGKAEVKAQVLLYTLTRTLIGGEGASLALQARWETLLDRGNGDASRQHGKQLLRLYACRHLYHHGEEWRGKAEEEGRRASTLRDFWCNANASTTCPETESDE